MCPTCGRRKARRACPALAREICSVCCGTKRQTEIRCPPDCVYLGRARVHPPAAVQRQQDRDRRFLTPLIVDLTEAQAAVFVQIQAFLNRYGSPTLGSLLDDHVAEAIGSLVATLETEERGVIYEHRPDGLPAQHLASELKALINEFGRRAPAPRRGDVLAALRQVERGARSARKSLEGDRRAYLQLVARLMQQTDSSGANLLAEEPGTAAQVSPSRLIVP